MAITDIINNTREAILNLFNLFPKRNEPTPLDKLQSALKGTGIFIVVVISGIVIIKVIGLVD